VFRLFSGCFQAVFRLFSGALGTNKGQGAIAEGGGPLQVICNTKQRYFQGSSWFNSLPSHIMSSIVQLQQLKKHRFQQLKENIKHDMKCFMIPSFLRPHVEVSSFKTSNPAIAPGAFITF